jgi:hypothetical protein
MPPKTPQQKKQEAYQQERFSMDHNPHAARRNKPRDRAQEERRLRRKSNELVRVPEKAAASEDREPIVDPRERGRSWHIGGGTIPLEEKVKFLLARRIWRTAWNCFKRPYSPQGREKFKRIVISIMQGKTEQSAEIARLFHDMIYGEHSRYELVLTQHVAERQAWILHFLRDEPSVGGEFKKWIRKMLERYPENPR